MIFISKALHDHMTGIISERLALLYGLSVEAAARVRFAAKFHDIGKRKIPTTILNKPGKLTEDEFDIVKLHTAYGYTMLKSFEGTAADMARFAAMYHHERWDGKGYWGMKKEDQPVFVRIIALADVYTALLEERPYKKAWDINDALAYIAENAGSQFDPKLTALFIPMALELKEVIH